jgi:hypothetical protein
MEAAMKGVGWVVDGKLVRGVVQLKLALGYPSSPIMHLMQVTEEYNQFDATN